MRRIIMAALAVATAAVAIPTVALYARQSNDDRLAITLRSFGFLPLALPHELMSVGSLYYVDSSVRFFQEICRADATDLEGAVKVSRAGNVKENALRNGRFATDVQVDVNWLIGGDVKHDYKQTVHYSLTDVSVEEIALDRNNEIFGKLMSKPSCNNAVMEVIHAGGYVCQGQRMLQATAEYKLDLESEGGVATKTNTSSDIKDKVKLAIETQSSHSVIEKQGRLFSGSALKYGVAMNPLCLAPPEGRFKRVLPRSVFGRITNFVLFRVVEPIWPREQERSRVAEVSATAGGG